MLLLLDAEISLPCEEAHVLLPFDPHKKILGVCVCADRFLEGTRFGGQGPPMLAHTPTSVSQNRRPSRMLASLWDPFKATPKGYPQKKMAI